VVIRRYSAPCRAPNRNGGGGPRGRTPLR
jgi:hypothetical protein